MSLPFTQLMRKFLKNARLESEKTSAAHPRMRMLNKGLALTVALFSVLYLVQVNALATKGYQIKDLEKRISEQKKQNERLQMKIIERQSLGSLQEKVDSLGLVRTERIEYLKASSQSVAAVR